MTLFIAKPADGVAWVTGASSGIGRQLALDLARDGYVVAASARNEERLAALVGDGAGLSGRVVAFPCDITDEGSMIAAVEAIERELGPIALAVLNAGTSVPTAGERLQSSAIAKIISTNLTGTANCLVPLIDAMKARRRGQVALVGSLTAYFGLPTTAVYGGTKAAINLMAESLKFDLDKLNIRIQVINPGFVDTELTAKNKFPMPALVSVEVASRRIRDGLKAGAFEITFPRRLAWTMKLLRLFPHWILHPLLNRATGWAKRPLGISNTKL